MAAHASSLRHVLVVGGSIAGLSAVGELRQKGYDGRITVLERDLFAPIRTPELSKKILTGALSLEQIRLNWNPAFDVEFIKGSSTALDLSTRSVQANIEGSEERLTFDGLVIATGADARGRADYSVSPNMHVIRRASDAIAIREQLANASTVSVVGAGFLGLEVAASCLSLGKRVFLIEFGNSIFSGRFGKKFEQAVLDLYAESSVETLFGQTPHIIGPSELALTPSGRTIKSDLVVWCVGAKPEIAWLEGSGLLLKDGLVCDEMLRPPATTMVVAAGDIVRAPNLLYGTLMRVEHWTNAIDQGRAAARSLLGVGSCTNDAVPYVWSNIFGRKIEIVGTSLGANRREFVSQEEAGWVGERHFVGARLIGVAGIAPLGDPGLFPRMRHQLAQSVC